MPYKMALPDKIPEKFDIRLQFMRHYNEPDMKLTVSMEELVQHQSIEYLMSFDAGKTGNFDVVLMHNKEKEFIGIGEHQQLGSAAPPKATTTTGTKPTVSRHDVPKAAAPKASAQVPKKAVK